MSHQNPWKTLHTREVYKNAWIRLREDAVLTPSGNKGIYSVVEAKAAIGIVPLTADMQTYLVGQYRYPLDVYSWEIPEGGGLDGEAVVDGAKRELREETGLAAQQWTFLGNIYTSNCFTNEVGHIFLAEGLEQHSTQPDDTEDLTIKRLPFMQAWEMALNGEIKDALAIIGLMRTYHFLKGQGRI